jgi:hypothetical protein
MLVQQRVTTLRHEAAQWAASYSFRQNAEDYFAYSTARVSRMTVTLICPG